MFLALRRLLIILAIGLAVAGCASPEAARQRDGGPGADIGNRKPTVVPLGSKFYEVTPAPFLSGQNARLPQPPGGSAVR